MPITTQTTPAELAALADKLAADWAARVARIAAAGYSRRVSLRNGADEVIITVGPDSYGQCWEVNGTGFEDCHGGNIRVGDTRSRYFGEDLDRAKAYANGWVADLVAKGYRIAD